MKIVSLQENLKQGLFVASHIAIKNANLPILNNVLIKAGDGNVKIISTNLEMGIINNVRGKIEAEGAFTVDSKIISDYVNLLPNKKVEIKLSGDNLVISSGNYKTKIKGQSAEEFPLIPTVDKTKCYSAETEAFKKAVGRVLFSASVSESRLELSGVLFNFSKDKLVLAATDSYRLAEKSLAIKNNGQAEEKIIVPAKTLQELIRILSAGSEEENELKIYLSENQIMFSCGNTELISRLIEGQYPDYQQIIPTASKTNVLVDRAELIRAVKMSSLFSKTGINDVNLDFPAGKNIVMVSAVSGQTGESTTEIEAKTSGVDNGVVVNHRYLLDGLNNLDCELVKIEVVDNNTPCVIRPEKDNGYLYVIMPIKQ
jgi:DNA polymerase-3 subunit beta